MTWSRCAGLGAAAPLLLALILGGGCSALFTTRPPPPPVAHHPCALTISNETGLVIDYHVGDQRRGAAFLSEDPTLALSPTSASLAARARRLGIAGLSTGLVGAVPMGVGLMGLVPGEDFIGSRTAAISAGVGAVLMGVGLALATRSGALRRDAENALHDHVAGRCVRIPGGDLLGSGAPQPGPDDARPVSPRPAR